MNSKKLPEWLLNNPVVNDFEFSRDENKWEYRGEYYEMIDTISCPHCNDDAENQVHIYWIQNQHSNLAGLGQCEKCKRVYWMEMVGK